MGRMDYWSKRFFDDSEVFADVFNTFFFQGKHVINPETLTSENPMEVLHSLRNRKLFLQRERDILKRVVCKRGRNCFFVLLGLEIQSFYDPTMPVRNLCYEVLNYLEQLNQIVWELEQTGKYASKEEMLASFSEKDKLVPVITLVVFLSDKEWPTRRLHDILALPDKEIAKCVHDYPLNIIVPNRMSEEEIMSYGQDMSTVLLSAKHASSCKELMDVINTYSAFQNMRYETARLIAEIVNMDMKIRKKEKTDMKRSMQEFFEPLREELLQQGIERGIEQGIEQGIARGIARGKVQGAIMAMLDMDIPEEVVINKVAAKFGLAKEQVQVELNKLQSVHV